MYYTYILHGSLGKYYVGYTSNLNQRLREHKNTKTKYTSKIGEITLVGYFEFHNASDARKKEIQIKKSGHIKRYISENNFVDVRH